MLNEDICETKYKAELIFVPFNFKHSVSLNCRYGKLL